MGKTPNKHLSKEDTQMAKKYIKACSMQLFIKKVQIKTTVRYHLTPVRMAIIQKSKDSKSWRGCGGKGGLIHCCWEFKVAQPLWKRAEGFCKQLKIELLCGNEIKQSHAFGEVRGSEISIDTCVPSPRQHHLEYLRYAIKPNVYWRMNGLKSVYRYIYACVYTHIYVNRHKSCNISQPNKEW